MTEPIDLVYAWCDDADPKWRAKREATAARFGVTFDAVHNGACRYRGGDMLRYSLRSVFRLAPWVGNVFVVMDDAHERMQDGGVQIAGVIVGAGDMKYRLHYGYKGI